MPRLPPTPSRARTDALIEAVRASDLKGIDKALTILEQHGQSPDDVGGCGDVAATFLNDQKALAKQVLSRLIRSGMNPNAVNVDGNNVVHAMIAHDTTPAMLRCMIEAGGDVDQMGVWVRDRHDETVAVTPLEHALAHGCERLVEALLCDADHLVDRVNATNPVHGWTPLYWVCNAWTTTSEDPFCRWARLARTLIGWGADPDKPLGFDEESPRSIARDAMVHVLSEASVAYQRQRLTLALPTSRRDAAPFRPRL